MSEDRLTSNDDLELAPVTAFDGPLLRFDFPGLRIGVAEYDEGPTGCTVFAFAETAAMSVDVRGGSPGLLGDRELADAICLAGGSIYGTEAATGVQAELFAERRYSTNWESIALVSGGIIFDFRRRNNAIYPDKALGRVALRAAQEGVFPLGPRGAGRSATAGKNFDFWQGEPAGQGGAFRQIGPTRIAFFTVVNAIGAIVDRSGKTVRGNLDPVTGMRHSYVEGLTRLGAGEQASEPAPGNTTVSVLITNQILGAWNLRQLGRQVHASMARAIQPFHGPHDGDILFTVTTGEVENPDLSPIDLAGWASELAWDAVLTSFID